MSDLTRPTRILRAAEVLIAERGLGASLQDIASAAGSRNKSAVHYYFGNREGLIAAAVNARLNEMESTRSQMLADAGSQPEDIRSLVSMLVLPMVQIVDGADSTHFARFFDRIRYHLALNGEHVLQDANHPSLRIIIRRITTNITMVPAQDRRFRTDSMASSLLALVADYEQAAPSLDNGARERRHEELIDVLTGLLTATPSTVAPR